MSFPDVERFINRRQVTIEGIKELARTNQASTSGLSSFPKSVIHNFTRCVLFIFALRNTRGGKIAVILNTPPARVAQRTTQGSGQILLQLERSFLLQKPVTQLSQISHSHTWPEPWRGEEQNKYQRKRWERGSQMRAGVLPHPAPPHRNVDDALAEKFRNGHVEVDGNVPVRSITWSDPIKLKSFFERRRRVQTAADSNAYHDIGPETTA